MRLITTLCALPLAACAAVLDDPQLEQRIDQLGIEARVGFCHQSVDTLARWSDDPNVASAVWYLCENVRKLYTNLSEHVR